MDEGQLMLVVHPTTAIFPGKTLEEAIKAFDDGFEEKAWGKLNSDIVQLCPQSRGIFSKERLSALKMAKPERRFRLHASIRVGQEKSDVSASTMGEREREVFRRIAELNVLMGDEPYVIHAGRRSEATKSEMLSNLKEIGKIFEEAGSKARIGVEPLYPEEGRWLLDSWEEWEELLNEGIPYALDLSHANILARKTGKRDEALLNRMAESPLCLEIHVSGNNGVKDRHEPLSDIPWWREALIKGTKKGVPIFSEGNALLNRER